MLVAAVSNGVALTVGASGGIMGLLGLLFVLGRVQGRDVPVGIAHAMRQYALTYAAMVVVFGFLVPNVDNVAHIGGFITGALVGLALPPLRGVGGRDLQHVGAGCCCTRSTRPPRWRSSSPPSTWSACSARHPGSTPPRCEPTSLAQSTAARAAATEFQSPSRS